MGMKFLLLFITLSALFLTLHAQADGSAAKSEVGPPKLRSRSRTLLSEPDPEKSIADPPAGKDLERADDEERDTAAEAPESRKLGRHHSPDKSVAGGGVIIGGLVTAIFAAVYCYIRVTRRRAAESLT